MPRTGGAPKRAGEIFVSSGSQVNRTYCRRFRTDDVAALLKADVRSGFEYYCLSSIVLPEIVLYPDSNKIGTMASKASAEGEREFSVAFLRLEPVDYWEGEGPK